MRDNLGEDNISRLVSDDWERTIGGSVCTTLGGADSTWEDIFHELSSESG